MNKLVSRSPVLRFKQGKKIIKAWGGAVIYNSFGLYSPSVSEAVRKFQPTKKYYTLLELRNKIFKNLQNYEKFAKSQMTKVKSKSKGTSNPNRFISIYDKNGVWADNANKEGLTNREAVKRFLREKLGLVGKAADGIWGKNTEAAYLKYLLNNKLKFTPPTLEDTTNWATIPQETQETSFRPSPEEMRRINGFKLGGLINFIREVLPPH